MSARINIKAVAEREGVALATFRRWRRQAEEAGIVVEWADERSCDEALVRIGRRRVSKFAKPAGLGAVATTTAPRAAAVAGGGREAEIERARAMAEDEYRRYQAELALGEAGSAKVAEECLGRWRKALEFANSMVNGREKDLEHSKIWIRRADHEAVYAATLAAVARQLAALEVQVLAEVERAVSAIDREGVVRAAFERMREQMRRADYLQ